VFQGTTAFYNISSLILTEIDQALQATSFGSVARVCVVPGEFAWDECECGTLAASPQRFFFSDEFPEGALGRGLVRTSVCDLPWIVADILFIIARCAPQPTSPGLAPPCEDLAAAAQVLLSDASVVMRETARVLCELTANGDIIDYVMGDQITQGPAGACVGTQLQVFVAVER